MKTTFALALVLAAQACVPADEDLGTTAFQLGLQPTGGSTNHFYWAAYEDAPYIYKGCPEPGPQPWAERATLHARRGESQLEVELGTAVALDVQALSAPRGVRLTPNPRGVTITVGDPFVGDPFVWSIRVIHERCAYDLEAEIVYE